MKPPLSLHEQVMGAMVRLHPTCEEEFSSSVSLQQKLTVLGSQYRQLWEKERAQEEGDEFFHNLVKMIEKLTNDSPVHRQRTELWGFGFKDQ